MASRGVPGTAARKTIDITPRRFYKSNMNGHGRFQGKVLFGVLLAAVCLGGQTSMATQYVWPLEGSKNITSGFCAHRDAHYHGGIDISTGGGEGLKVLAADSGFVFRITTSYWGYGKAVYLKLADGRIAVYGHLSQFSPAIRRYVEKQQHSLKRYNTNLFPLPDELPVGRGEIIGYTGQTGYGPPHLHFEIRTANNFPLNPSTVDVDYDDQFAPRFRGLVVRPLLSADPQARVEGDLFPVYVTAEKAGRAGRYVVKKPVAVDGAIVLAADCADPTGYKGYAMVPYRLTVRVNDLRFFEMTYDSLDFGLTRQVDLDYDFAWMAAGGDRVHNLYRHPANLMVWYNPDLGDGILDPTRLDSPLAPGENHLTISAIDAAGNKATLKLVLLFNKSPHAESVRLEQIRGQWHITGHAADPDDYIARLLLRHKAKDTETWKTVWEKADSVTFENFSYVVPGPFPGGDPLELVLVDRWGAEGVFPFAAPGGLPSELAPRKMQALPVVADFAPAGLVVHAAQREISVSDDQLVMQIRTLNPLARKPGFFVNAEDFLAMTADGFWGRFALNEDRSGLKRALHPQEKKTGGDILIWPSELAAIGPASGGMVFSADSLARARFNAGDVYDGGFFRIRPFVFPKKLEPTSILYSFEPIAVPFARKVEVGISYADLAAAVDDLALYALENDRISWKYLGRDVDAGGKFMTAKVWSFGPYALIADTTPPKISRVVPGKGAQTGNRRPEITFRIVDDLSGIGSDKDVEILLDGEWLIPEYDPETEMGRTQPQKDLELGKHKLEITARDRVGHEGVFLRYFTVVEKK